jgi:hypothetical protein
MAESDSQNHPDDNPIRRDSIKTAKEIFGSGEPALRLSALNKGDILDLICLVDEEGNKTAQARFEVVRPMTLGLSDSQKNPHIIPLWGPAMEDNLGTELSVQGSAVGSLLSPTAIQNGLPLKLWNPETNEAVITPPIASFAIKRVVDGELKEIPINAVALAVESSGHIKYDDLFKKALLATSTLPKTRKGFEAEDNGNIVFSPINYNVNPDDGRLVEDPAQERSSVYIFDSANKQMVVLQKDKLDTVQICIVPDVSAEDAEKMRDKISWDTSMIYRLDKAMIVYNSSTAPSIDGSINFKPSEADASNLGFKVDEQRNPGIEKVVRPEIVITNDGGVYIEPPLYADWQQAKNVLKEKVAAKLDSENVNITLGDKSVVFSREPDLGGVEEIFHRLSN